MDSEAELENLVNVMCRKTAHIIVESRLGRKIHTPCRVHAAPPDWFNLSTNDMPEVVKEVKLLLASASSLSDSAAPLFSFCVEISLKTTDGVSLVLEQWVLSLDRTSGATTSQSDDVIGHFGVLLKSLVVMSRLTPAYRLSRHQSPESHIIFYKIYVGKPALQSLGETRSLMSIGEVSTPGGNLRLEVHHRTQLTISTSSEPIVIKSDHFKPDMSPRVRRLTGFADRRHSDSVEMAGASSSSSSNMDTKTPGGSSTDSDQRRRVAAFADDPVERPPALLAADVPFWRLIGEPPPADVSMVESGRASDQARPPAAAAEPAAGTPTPSASQSAAAADDFVMVELRTPFSESDSDGELSAFFRRRQTAPKSPSAPTTNTTTTAAAADSQVITLSQQLASFQLQALAFDEMVQQLSQAEPDAK